MACKAKTPANEKIEIDRRKERLIQELDWELGGDRRACRKRRELLAKLVQEVNSWWGCQTKINYLVNKCYFCVNGPSASPGNLGVAKAWGGVHFLGSWPD